MESARISYDGQITIPPKIRQKLGLKYGDKITFTVENDRLIMYNSSAKAIGDLQRSFAGEAENAGIENERDVVDIVKEIRAERSVLYKCE